MVALTGAEKRRASRRPAVCAVQREKISHGKRENDSERGRRGKDVGRIVELVKFGGGDDDE